MGVVCREGGDVAVAPPHLLLCVAGLGGIQGYREGWGAAVAVGPAPVPYPAHASHPAAASASAALALFLALCVQVTESEHIDGVRLGARAVMSLLAAGGACQGRGGGLRV